MPALKIHLASFFFCLALAACSSPPRPLTVSAAANLQTAFTEIGAAFEKQNGTPVTLNYGATGSLAQQIIQGAPVDVFASADVATVDDLAKRGFIITDTVQIYARGQIVLYTRADNPIPLQSLSDLANADVKRIAIANPETAPYGHAARQALQNSKLWDGLQPKIVIAENIQQTQQYADSGNVDAAITARSLAVGSKGKWTEIPQGLYTPIDQALGVVKGRPNESTARAFAAFVTGPAGRAVLVKYGYGLPAVNR
ncbi:MAG: molybdate ABC transporter substrate-binding protein [Chloroflexi bacterium]|nr:molybdate ABC transporter substrate-binding protein [Chloroflexota bacterium]